MLWLRSMKDKGFLSREGSRQKGHWVVHIQDKERVQLLSLISSR